MFAADLIDTNALLNVVWVSLAAGVGGTAAFSLAIVGATRFVDMRREGRSVEATIYVLLALAGTGLCVAAVAVGLFAILNK